PALARDDADASRGKRSERRAVRPRSVDGRIRLPGQARSGRHSERPVLRLPQQRRVVSEVAGVMRERQPRLLVIWGRYDLSSDPSEPHAYTHDVPSAEVHVLDAGHFALDTAADEIAVLVRNFLGSPSKR